MQGRAARAALMLIDQFICRRAVTIFLTALLAFRICGGGTPLPNERLLSGRIDHGDCDARRAAGRSALLVRPLCQAPRLDPPSPQRRVPRPFAPRERWQGEAQARHRRDARRAGSPGGLPHRHRAGFRHRRGRDGDVVDARGPSGHDDLVGILRRRLGDRRCQAAQAQGRHDHQGALRRAARPFEGRSQIRHRVHLERHDVRRARAERRLDRGRPRRRHDLRRDLGGLRATARLGASSMSSPSHGRRRSAAKPRTEC